MSGAGRIMSTTPFEMRCNASTTRNDSAELYFVGLQKGTTTAREFSDG